MEIGFHNTKQDIRLMADMEKHGSPPREESPGQRQRLTATKCFRQIFRHIFHWTIALLAMAVFAWSMLGIIMLCYGSFNSSVRSGMPCIAGMNTTNALEMSCHIQNNDMPLWMALASGCPSIVVEVWLSNSQEVVVGHGQNETLSSVYIEPLVELLGQMKFVRTQDRGKHLFGAENLEGNLLESLVLVLVMVGNGTALWPHLSEVLEPLRQAGYLTRFDGLDILQRPLTVVMSGNAPFKEVIAQGSERDMFFDAPLDLMSTSSDGAIELLSQEEPPTGRENSKHGQQPIVQSSTESTREAYLKNPAIYSIANSYSASASFQQSVGQLREGRPTDRQLDVIRAQVGGAHARGLKARYYDLPQVSEKEMEYLWRALAREGVDVLSISHE